MESIEDAVLNISPEGYFIYSNDSEKQLLGLELLEQSRQYMDAFIIKNEDGSIITDDPIANCIEKHIDVNGKNYVLLLMSNKNQLTIQYSIRAIYNTHNKLTGVVFAFRDETNSREIEKELEYNASHDNLTGLINRRQFEVEAQYVIENFKSGDIGHWICYIDLDRFKIVNDTCGHPAGDNLLLQISELIRSKVRRGDFVSRLGGDEFGILMINCPLNSATRVMKNIRTAIDEFQLVWDEHVMKVGSSIGMAHVWKSQLILNDLLRNADTACYIAKRKGGSRIHVHHDDDKEIAAEQDQMSWVSRINSALENNKFVLFAQQILAMDENDSCPRYEVLLRMIDKDGKLIAPSLFLPAAERFKLSRKIDVWVFEKTLAILNENETIDIQLSINVTADLFSDENLTNGIVEKMRQYPHIANRLCVEITESTAISHMNDAKRVFEQLRSVGVKIALDDFGTGVSSFGYLQQLPIDYIKIDGQFVRNCSNNSVDQAIVKCIHEAAASTGKQTVAEYVESDEIKLFLKKIGINYLQGYGIKTPEPLNDVLLKLSSESNKVINLFKNVN